MGRSPHGVGVYDVESAVDIGLLELLPLHFHNGTYRRLHGIFGGRTLSNRPIQTGFTNSQQHLQLIDWIELTML